MRYGVNSTHRTLLIALLLAACAAQATARGVVTEVEGSLDQVTQFTVLVDGEEMTFVPSAAGDYDFPLSHLRDHLRSGEPVLVGWTVEDGIRIAVRLADG